MDLGYDFTRANFIGAGVRTFYHRGDVVQQGNIGGNLFFDAGAQHLHHHLAAFVQGGGMHLRNAGGGQRGGVKTRVRIGNAAAQCGFHQGPRLHAVERCHPVLQLGQFIGDIGRHQIAAGGKNLPELDEDWPQFL